MALVRAVEGIKVRESVPVLGRALESPLPELRESAIFALRKIDSAGAVPLLVNALDDTSTRVVYSATVGLYRAERRNLQGSAGYAAPARSFQKEPARYVESWKAWWEETGKKKYQDALDGETDVTPEPDTALEYDKERFEALLAEAKAFLRQPGRSGAEAIAKYEAALAARPNHPDNVEIEFEIAKILNHESPVFTLANLMDTLVFLEEMDTRYHASKNMLALMARGYLATSYRVVEGDLERSADIWLSFLDIPDEELELPDQWIRDIQGPRGVVSDQRLLHLHRQWTNTLKNGALEGFVTAKLGDRGGGNPKGKLAILIELQKQRPDDERYQKRIEKERARYEAMVTGAPITWIPAPNSK